MRAPHGTGIVIAVVLGLVVWTCFGYLAYLAYTTTTKPTPAQFTVVDVTPVPTPRPRAYVDEIAPHVYRIHDTETGVVCYTNGEFSTAISCVNPPQWHTAVPYED